MNRIFVGLDRVHFPFSAIRFFLMRGNIPVGRTYILCPLQFCEPRTNRRQRAQKTAGTQ